MLPGNISLQNRMIPCVTEGNDKKYFKLFVSAY